MYRILMLLFGKRFIHDLARMVAEEAIRAYEMGQEGQTIYFPEVNFGEGFKVGGTDA